MPSPLKKLSRRISSVSIEEETPPATPNTPTDQSFKIPAKRPVGRPKKKQRGSNPYGRKGKPVEVADQLTDTMSVSSSRVPSRSSTPLPQNSIEVTVQDVRHDGNCYTDAISVALYGTREQSGEIRRQLYVDFLQRVATGDFNIIMPTTDLPILEHLNRHLCDSDEDAAAHVMAYADRMSRDGEWAEVNDGIIAAIVFQRPIVLLHPRVVAGGIDIGIDWEEADQLRAEIFFPDGDFMALDRLYRQDVTKFAGTHIIEDETRQRAVDHPLVIWHNGHTIHGHFQPFVFSVAQGRRRSVSLETTSSVRRSERIASRIDTPIASEDNINAESFRAYKECGRNQQKKLRKQYAKWDRRRRSKQDIVCNHPGVGCWATDSDHDPPSPLDLGHFGDKICEHCQAWLLPEETSRHCCAHGSVRVDDFNEKVPDEIIELLSRHSKEAYAYNTLLAMASSITDGDEHSGEGRVCLLNGMVSHMLSDLSPGQGQPMFNELYCLNPAEAHRARQGMDVFGNNIDEQLLFDLDAFMREHNVLAQQFSTSYELWQEAKQRAERRGRPLPAYTMVIMQKRGDPGPCAARIRPPAPNEVSAVYRMPPDESIPNLPRGLRMAIREPDAQRRKVLRVVRYWDPNMPSLLYPLLFPFGQPGFRKGIPTVRPRESARKKKATQYVEDEVAVQPAEEDLDERSSIGSVEGSAVEDGDKEEMADDGVNIRRNLPKPRDGPLKNISRREYYRYVMQRRGPLTEIDNDSDCHFPIWRTRFLGQKFLIEMMWTIEHQEAYYSKLFQDNMRVSTAKEFTEALERGLPVGAKLGRCYFTPASYQGSKRHMQRALNDALSIAREVGTPVFFVTFTPSPSWEVLKNTLKQEETPADAPDLMCRAFIQARRELLKDLEERGVLGGYGSVVGHSESLEFQEKGMPHLHKILSLDKEKIDAASAEFVDKYITAEFMPRAEAVAKFGEELARHLWEDLYPLLIHACSPRCKSHRGRCKYGFPQPFSPQTIIATNQKPIYRRRKPADGGAELILPNGKVVNNQWVVPHNLSMLFKYESHHCIEYITGDELFVLQYIYKYIYKGTDMCYVDVTKKRADQQGGQLIYDYDEYNQVFTCRRMGPFEAFMRLYQEPFVRQSHTVKAYTVHKPNEQQVQFRGGEELDVAQKVAGGEKKTPFMGYFELCAIDKEAAKYTFAEFGKHYRWTGKQWQKYKRIAVGMKSITRIYPVSPSDHERFAIRLLATHVTGQSAYRAKLASIDAYKIAFTDDGQRINFATFVDAAQYYGLLESDDIWVQTLKEASDRILGARRFTNFFGQLLLFSEPSDPAALFEKFFKRMINYRRYDQLDPAQQEEMRQVVLRRLMQIFMNAGRSCTDFGIPEPDQFDVNDDFYYDFPVVAADQPTDVDDDDDARGEMIRQTDLIVIDEISMMDRRDFEHVNGICKDLASPPIMGQRPFGGKVVLLSGDFDQLLTVVPHGRAADQVDACLRRHEFWPQFEQGRIHLVQNMRLQPGEQQFRAWLQDISKGRNFIRIDEDGINGTIGPVKIPADRMVDSTDELIAKTFDCDPSNVEEMASRVIFAPVNRTIDTLNQKILAKLPAEIHTSFYAIDQPDPEFIEAMQDDAIAQAAYQAESLHRITGGSLPHYKLELKINAIVMLLRNLDISRGLANGTRMVITGLGEHTIYGKIIRKNGQLAKNETAIGRARFHHQTKCFRDIGGLKMIRIQFPVKLCYASTINKGQGTTATGKVGLDLSSEVFQPGHLYTAISRLTKYENLFVYNGRPRQPGEDGEVRNIVWKWE